MRIGLRLQLGGALPESTWEDECYQALSSCMQSTEYCFSLLIVSFFVYIYSSFAHVLGSHISVS